MTVIRKDLNKRDKPLCNGQHQMTRRQKTRGAALLTFGKGDFKNPFPDAVKLSRKVYLESRHNTLLKTLEEQGGGIKEKRKERK